jgi:chromosomal replication initiation ATPase DnaA
MNFQQIVEMVSWKHRLPSDRVLSHIRTAPEVRARHEIMFILHNNSYSITEITKLMNRDYTSVLNGIKRHKERMK